MRRTDRITPVEAKDALWTYSYGKRPYTARAFERPDRGFQLFVKWSNHARPGRDKREQAGLRIRVRDLRTGRLSPQLIRTAERVVQAFQAKLLSGRLPVENSSPERPAELATSALTLREGFDLALDMTTGKYASSQTRRYEQMVNYRARLFGTVEQPHAMVDPFLPWMAFEPKYTRALWRAMADRWVATDGKEFGVRAAEQVIDALYCVAAWLREEQYIPADAARPPEQWRKKLKEEWAARTGQRRTRPNRPRHTDVEYRRIFAAITDPRVDPRIRLAIEIGAECRTGQVLRCTRSMLMLTDVEPGAYEALTGGALGRIVIPGVGKKHGEVIVFYA